MHLIVTGGINSGKTTRLRSLAERFERAEGFLCPKVFRDGSCIGYDLFLLPTGEEIPFIRISSEVDPSEQVEEKLGDFMFYKNGFHQAAAHLEKLSRNLQLPQKDLLKAQPVFVDELGLLEEKGRGFYPAVRNLVDQGAMLAASIRRSSLETLLYTLDLEPCQWIEVD